MTAPHIQNRQLLATCWTWAGDAAPARGDERSPVSIHDRVAAVAAAGWSGVGLVHADLLPLQDELGYSGLRSLITDAGLQHIELEFISNWWATGELRAASDQVRRDLFTAAAELGVTTIKVGAQLTAFGTSDLVGPEAFAEAFDALATDAGNHGVRVALEPMPMSNLQTLQAGYRLRHWRGQPPRRTGRRHLARPSRRHSERVLARHPAHGQGLRGRAR